VISTLSRHSRRALAIHLSTIVFARGTGQASSGSSARPRHPEVHQEVAGLLRYPLTRRVGGDPGHVHPPPAMLDNEQDVQAAQQHSTGKKSAARMVLARASRNARQDCPARRGAGSMPAFLRIRHTVDGASSWPRPTSVAEQVSLRQRQAKRHRPPGKNLQLPPFSRKDHPIRRTATREKHQLPSAGDALGCTPAATITPYPPAKAVTADAEASSHRQARRPKALPAMFLVGT
jgi:hypothetical protein